MNKSLNNDLKNAALKNAYIDTLLAVSEGDYRWNNAVKKYGAVRNADKQRKVILSKYGKLIALLLETGWQTNPKLAVVICRGIKDTLQKMNENLDAYFE